MNQKPLVAIMSHSGANDTVGRHWPFYMRAGCDILGVGRVDTKCLWPQVGQGRFVGEYQIGKESYATGDNHLLRFVQLINYWLNDETLKDTTHLIVIEYDGVFFAEPPKFHTDTFYAKLAGGGGEGFLGDKYVHTPWCMDRICAGRIHKYGQAMLRAKLFEQGFLDRWFGLMIDLFDLQWRDTGAGTYTQNTLDTPEKLEDARRAIAAGAWYVHGVKTAAQLRELART